MQEAGDEAGEAEAEGPAEEEKSEELEDLQALLERMRTVRATVTMGYTTDTIKEQRPGLADNSAGH